MRILVGFVFAFLAGLVHAQAFPNKPLKFIVPYPPGGGTDILGRALGQLIGESVGQLVIIENRPGANGAVGSDVVAKSPADGYTVGFAGSSTHVLNPLLYKLNYDPVTDFTPITTVATTAFVIIVKPDSELKSLGNLLGATRQPGKLSYGSFGNASAGHLAAEMFKYTAKVDMVHVPYKGSAPGQMDVMGGVIPLMFSDMSAMPHVKSGKLRALAVTGGKRLASYPEIPTVAESGVPGYDVQGWFAVYGPAGLPRPVLDRLNAEFVKALSGANCARAGGPRLKPATTTPEGLAALMRRTARKGQADRRSEDQGGMSSGDKADLIAELGKLGARDPESARLMGMIVALAGEVFVLKAQLERLTRALEAGGAVDAKRLAAAAAQEGMTKWLESEEAAFSRSLTAPYLEPDQSINSTSWMRSK